MNISKTMTITTTTTVAGILRGMVKLWDIQSRLKISKNIQ